MKMSIRLIIRDDNVKRDGTEPLYFQVFLDKEMIRIMRVKHEHIIDGSLVFTAHKTRNKNVKTVSIPLHSIALKFVTGNAGRLFRTYTDQYIRRTLHKIANHLEWTIRPGTRLAPTLLNLVAM